MKRPFAILLTTVLVGTGAATIQIDALAADSYPSRPIRLIIPFPPAGAGDIIGRLLSAKLNDELGQPLVVENRAGGNQVIATQLTAKASPDGHTLLLASASHAINPALLKNLPYDTKKDFTAITLVAEAPTIIVAHPSLGINNIQELIALAKSRSGRINYASSGVGTAGHLGIEMLKASAGIELLHVPYKGASQALTDVVSGRVPIICTSLLAAMPHVKAGVLRALAITGPTRSNVALDVPTVAEQGLPGFHSTSWYTLVGPAGIPRRTVERLHTATVKVIKLPDVADKLLSQGAAQPIGLNPEETTKFIQREIARWTELIERAGIKAE